MVPRRLRAEAARSIIAGASVARIQLYTGGVLRKRFSARIPSRRTPASAADTAWECLNKAQLALRCGATPNYKRAALSAASTRSSRKGTLRMRTPVAS